MKADGTSRRRQGPSPLDEIMQRVQEISRENERLVRQLAQGEYRFRRLAKAVWRVQEEERRNIALELHDGLGQVLTALINDLEHGMSENGRTDGNTPVKLAKTALSEVRRMSRALRPSVLDDLGLVAALRWLARTTSESSGLEVSLDLADEELAIDRQVETLVFRIVQEALTNVVKHARATRARIVIGMNDGVLEASVSDNGCGFDAEPHVRGSENGFGVRGMRDRAELFGGQLDVSSAAGEGTLVLLRLAEQAE